MFITIKQSCYQSRLTNDKKMFSNSLSKFLSKKNSLSTICYSASLLARFLSVLGLQKCVWILKCLSLMTK